MQFDDEMAAFFAGGVSVCIASRNASLVPSIARAKSCRLIRSTPTRIRVVVSVAHAGECLEDVRASGMISAALSRPSTHRSLQFKGSDARIEALTEEDRASMALYETAFAASIGPLGFARTFTHSFL